jgi:hypothetical protein
MEINYKLVLLQWSCGSWKPRKAFFKVMIEKRQLMFSVFGNVWGRKGGGTRGGWFLVAECFPVKCLGMNGMSLCETWINWSGRRDWSSKVEIRRNSGDNGVPKASRMIKFHDLISPRQTRKALPLQLPAPSPSPGLHFQLGRNSPLSSSSSVILYFFPASNSN